VSFGHFATGSEGYSGSDLHLLCKEAAMRPVRRMMADLALGQAQQGKGAAAGDQHPGQVSKRSSPAGRRRRSALQAVPRCGALRRHAGVSAASLLLTRRGTHPNRSWAP
jgi:hypothetical protein